MNPGFKVALGLALITVFTMGGCIHAQNEYERFRKENSGLSGFAKGFMRGASGDWFGLAKDVVGGVSGLKERHEAIQDWQTLAWGSLIATGIASAVAISNNNKRQNTSPAE